MMGKKSILRKPWLWLPSQWAHDLSPLALPTISNCLPCEDNQWQSLQWKNLTFSNPMGIAGGVDKTGKSLRAWEKLGAGFLEVGTVTPEPQGPNPGKIMDRNIPQQSLWNKMGFPNSGVKVLIENLKKFEDRKVPLFINVGKNRWTTNEDAYKDYSRCIRESHTYADAFVINLSSPNTEGLRDLQDEKYLNGFLNSVLETAKEVCPEKPVLLKLSPDMVDDSLFLTLQTSSSYVDGWIITNTTKQREANSPFPLDQGGVSGAPLKKLSFETLQKVVNFLGSNKKNKIVVSAGGVLTPSDVKDRLVAGADLVQTYSGLVFEGPLFFQKCLRELKRA